MMSAFLFGVSLVFSLSLIVWLAWALQPPIMALARNFGFAGLTSGPVYEIERPDGLIQVISLTAALAVLLGLNQYFGLYTVIPALMVGLATTWQRRSQPNWRQLAIYACTIALVTISLIIIFKIGNVWYREAVNHDLIIYIRGGEWALDHGTLASGATVDRSFQSGRETMDCALWIGNACPMNRGGMHTLVGLSALFSGAAIPAYSSLTLLPLVFLVSGALLANVPTTRLSPPTGIIIFFGLVLCLSAPILSSVINENLPTAAAALVIVSAVLVFISPDARRRPFLAAAALGGLAGLVALMYSEATWVIIALAAAHAFLCARQGSLSASMRNFMVQGGVAFVTWLATGNASLFIAIKSVFSVSSEVAKDAYWPNYFLEVANWRWLSVPFSGYLLGDNKDYPAAAGAIGTLLICILCLFQRERIRLFVPLGIVAMAILAIELTDYYYGVHKVVELFGPMVVAVGLGVLIQNQRAHESKTVIRRDSLRAAFAIIVMVQAYSVVNYGQRSRHVYTAFDTWAIGLDDQAEFERLNNGDIALLNDLSWVYRDRFSKSNWSQYLAQREGARIVAGPFSSDIPRGGYTATSINDTLKWVDHVDWVIQAANLPDQERIAGYEGAPTYEAGRYELVDLRDMRLPAFFQGEGWWEREVGHTWTRGTFTLDVLGETGYTGAPVGQVPVVDLELGFYSPPADGSVSVMRNGELLETLSATVTQIRLPVTDGYQVFEIRPSWEVQSPADIGQSGDTRKLFAAVSRITSRFVSANQDAQRP